MPYPSQRILKYLCYLTIGFYCSTCLGQKTNFNTQRNWAISKREVSFGAGVNQFLGDLGGLDKAIPTHPAPSTGWNSEFRYRFRFHPYYATASTLQFGMLRGNDAHHSDTYQRSRNLNFRSFFIQFSQRFDIILFARERSGARYAIPGRRKNYQCYVFAGIGLMYFNPQASYNNSWINLHPLNTEGQGLPGGAAAYSQYSATIPVGIGFRKRLAKMWKIGFELTYVSTFSDYIDDAGGNYYDPTQLAMAYGDLSAQLSNRSKQNVSWFTPGQSRGQAKRDAFMYFSIHLCRNITYKKPKKKAVETNSKTE